MNELVSVVVVTYNSARFVIETLDSIAGQSWKNIELIVTDDCSKDHTVEICRKWMDQNQGRFFRTILVESEVNTGVSANINRGIKQSQGEWLSLPAGDDTLKPTCIEDNMTWIAEHPEVKVLFSRVELYDQVMDPSALMKTIPGEITPQSIVFPQRSVNSQYKMLLLADRIHFTPSLFLNKTILLEVGGFDERFKLLEDYPLWLNLTRNGHKLYFMDKVTVNYRSHANAINNSGNNDLINPNYFKMEDFRRIYTYPYLPADLRWNERFKWRVSQLFKNGSLRKNNPGNRFLYRLLAIYLNPFKYVILLKKKMNKKLVHDELYA